MHQSTAIMSVLEQNGEGFLVARRLDGRWSVEVAGGGEHVGESISDALGQATQTIALEKGIDPSAPAGMYSDPDPDQCWTIDPPLEFCERFVISDDTPELALRALDTLARKVG